MRIPAFLAVMLILAGSVFAASARPIKANVGDEFVILLDSNKTTGYEWQLASPINGNMLKLLKSEYMPGPTNRTGAPGKEEWSFMALNPGDTVISFKYVRPWEKSIKPAREKSLDIIIQGRPEFTGQDYLRLSTQQRVGKVQNYITSVRQGGVMIRNTPAFYAKKLDNFYAKQPSYKDKPLDIVLKTLIIMEYDWEERGVNKDALARQWLGEDLYQANRARLGR